MRLTKYLAAVCAAAMILTELPSGRVRRPVTLPVQAAQAPIPVPAGDSPSMGDVNQDGCPSVTDAHMLLEQIVTVKAEQYNLFSSDQMSAADVDGDGSVTAADARAILAYYALVGVGAYDKDLASFMEERQPEHTASGGYVSLGIDSLFVSHGTETAEVGVFVSDGSPLYAYELGIEVDGAEIIAAIPQTSHYEISDHRIADNILWYAAATHEEGDPFTGTLFTLKLRLPSDSPARSEIGIRFLSDQEQQPMLYGEEIGGGNRLDAVLKDGFIRIEPEATTAPAETTAVTTATTTTTAATTTETTTTTTETTTTTTETTATTTATTTTTTETTAETTSTTEPTPTVIETVTENGVIYRIMEEGTSRWAEVCGYTADIPSDLEIPSEVSYQPVRKIAREAFYKCARLNSVIVPESVQEIGEAAFAFTSLQRITILNDRCTIYDDASTFTSGFRGGQTDTVYGNYFDGIIYAYNGSEALQYAYRHSYSCSTMYEPTWKLDAAGTLTISGTGRMRDYGDLCMDKHAPWYDLREDIRSVIISPGITSIGAYAFDGCKNLTYVSIPEGVTAIPVSVFVGCDSLTDIDIPQSVTEIESLPYAWLEARRKENPLVIVNGHLFDGQGCSGDVVIPYGVKRIMPWAFDANEAITSVSIPDSVTSIGEWAFAWCPALRSVELPDSVTELGYNAFNYCRQLESVRLPSGLKELTDGNFPGEELHGVFACCQNLKQVEFPDGIRKIGHYAFAESALTEVTIPASVTELSVQAFAYCSGLKTLTVLNPDCSFYLRYGSETWIEGINDLVICGYDHSTAQAFADQFGFTFRSLGAAPGDPERILATGACGENLTYKIDGAWTLTISGTGFLEEATWKDSYTGKIRYVVVEDGVTGIGDVFEDHTDIVSVVLPDSVTTLSNRAFHGCTSLSSIRLPAGLKLIEDGHEPGDIFYGVGCFTGCTSLKSIEFPEGLEYIGAYTCFISGLTEVTIPESVKSIGSGAFGICKDLQKVTILNPDCRLEGLHTFFNDSSCMDNDPYAFSGVVVAPEGSAVQAFAQQKGYRFSPLGQTPEPVLGNVNGDTIINASDAAVVLIAAASIGAGRDAGLTDAQKKAADVNQDDSINASDAAIVLIYAAAVGAGKTDAKISDYV